MTNPVFERRVPGVGGFAQIRRDARVSVPVGVVGRDEERGDLGGERERRIARVFFPAILRADGTMAHKAGGAPNRSASIVALTRLQRATARRQVDEQHGQCDFVHLNTGPVGRAVQPHVLGPVAIGLLRDLQEAQDPPGVVVGAGRQETAGGLCEIARPDEVITAQVVVALGETPWDREAGNHAAAEVL